MTERIGKIRVAGRIFFQHLLQPQRLLGLILQDNDFLHVIHRTFRIIQ
jgi:hypothetical protein